MSFAKTTWVPGSLPAQNAAQMNRIEQGIAEAHIAVEGQFRAFIATNYSLNAYNAWVKVANFTSESWDDDNVWDAPNSRLVIPAGVPAGSRWAINFNLYVGAHYSYGYASLFKNNAEAVRLFQEFYGATTGDRIWKGKGEVAVQAGDVIDLRVQWDPNLAFTIGGAAAGSNSYIEGRRIH